MKKTTPKNHQTDQSSCSPLSSLNRHINDAPQTDSRTYSSTLEGMVLIEYSSLSPEQQSKLAQMGLVPNQTKTSLFFEILPHELKSRLWIGNKLNPLVVDFGMNWISQSRIKMSRSQVYKAIQRAATKAGLFSEKVRQERQLNTEQKHLPATL